MLRIIMLLLYIFGILNVAFCIATSAASTTTTTRPQLHGKFKGTSEGLTKRNVKVEEISKSLDSPQPEYYRPSSSFDRNRDNTNERPSSYSSPATAATSFDLNHKYPPKGGQYSSYSENKNKHLQDRFSLGHGNNYLGSSNSYGSYGNSIPVDFSSGNYGSSGHYNSGYDHKGYDDYNDYGHSSYLSSFGHGGDYYGKAELAKKFLLPLAGIAVLGVAAALYANPMLLQMGSVASPFGKKRRRRDVTENAKHSNDAQILAYQGHSENIEG